MTIHVTFAARSEETLKEAFERGNRRTWAASSAAWHIEMEEFQAAIDAHRRYHTIKLGLGYLVSTGELETGECLPPPFRPWPGAENKCAVKIFLRGRIEPNSVGKIDDCWIPYLEWTSKDTFLLLPWPWKDRAWVAGLRVTPADESGSLRPVFGSVCFRVGEKKIVGKLDEANTEIFDGTDKEFLSNAQNITGLLPWHLLALRYARLQNEGVLELPHHLALEYERILLKDTAYFRKRTDKAHEVTSNEDSGLFELAALVPEFYPPEQILSIGWKQCAERYRLLSGRKGEPDATFERRVRRWLNEENKI